DTKPTKDRSMVAAHGKAAGEKPAVFAFTVSDAVLGFVDCTGSNGVGPLGGSFGNVLVMDHGRPLLAQRFLYGEPGVVIPALIAIVRAALGVGGEDELRNRVGEEAVAAFTFAQGIFGAALFCHIAKNHNRAARMVGASQNG